jgi:hypothetical protein
MLLEQLTRRWWAGPWSIWGKLPSHCDFLRHRTSAAQARDWQDWVSDTWSRRPAAQAAQQRHAAAWRTTGRAPLEQRRALSDLADLPVAFVLQPGALPFAPRCFVRGVVMASSDSLGRACPLVFFQAVAPAWLRRSWRGRPPLRPEGDVLYWLSRIGARAHATGGDWAAMVRAVDALGDRFGGDGRRWPAQHRAILEALLQQHGLGEANDAAAHLIGVTHMPWADWPQPVVRAQAPVNAFWQQDAQGGYVNAGESLTELGGGAA